MCGFANVQMANVRMGNLRFCNEPVFIIPEIWILHFAQEYNTNSIRTFANPHICTLISLLHEFSEPHHGHGSGRHIQFQVSIFDMNFYRIQGEK